MSGLLYFLPRVSLAQFAPGGVLLRAVVEARGLSCGLADCQRLDDLAYAEVCGAGPDGSPGLIVSPLATGQGSGFRVQDATPRRLGYYPDDPHQRWTQISEVLWIAVDAAFPPTEPDLRRKQFFPGHIVRVQGSGCRVQEALDSRLSTLDLIVPILRRPESGQTTLPRDMYFDGAGRLVLELQEQYRALWEKTERVARLFFDRTAPDFGKIDLDEALTIALEAIGLNYRIGPAEQRVLKLVDTTNWEQILGAMVDLPFVLSVMAEAVEAEKKSAHSSRTPAHASASCGSSSVDSSPAASAEEKSG